MTKFTYDSLQVEQQLADYTFEPINRTTLALFAGASGDVNPIHIDIDFAHEAGFDDVFAQGMLIMAYLGRALTHWFPQTDIKEFGVRFVAITKLFDEITCKARVTEKFERAGEKCARLELQAITKNHEVKLTGGAIVGLP